MSNIIKVLRSKLVDDPTKGWTISGTPSPVRTTDDDGKSIVDPNVVSHSVYHNGLYKGRCKVPSTFNFNEVSGVILQEDEYQGTVFYRMLDSFTNLDDVTSSKEIGVSLQEWSS